MRLELGSGYCPTPGFTHLDLNPNAPQVDIVGPAFPLDLGDGCCDEIRAVDVLEHLPYRQTAAVLAEWARVLRPGGKLYVQVPDAEAIMQWYISDPLLLLDRLPDDVPQTREGGAAWRLLGGQDDDVCAKTGDDWRLNSHYALFSKDSLVLAMDAAGFVIDELTINGHPNLLVWARKR